jgi:hypothetical protein
MGTRRKLGSKSVAVLDLIARGHTYEQIPTLHPDLTYLDIFGAAREALGLDEQTSITYQRGRSRSARHTPAPMKSGPTKRTASSNNSFAPAAPSTESPPNSTASPAPSVTASPSGTQQH